MQKIQSPKQLIRFHAAYDLHETDTNKLVAVLFGNASGLTATMDARRMLRCAIVANLNWPEYRKANRLSVATMSETETIKAAIDLLGYEGLIKVAFAYREGAHIPAIDVYAIQD